MQEPPGEKGSVTLFTRHQLDLDVAPGPAGFYATDQSEHQPVPCSVALIAADGLAIISAVLAVFWCRGFLHGTSRLPLPLGAPFLSGELMVLLAAMFAYFTIKGRYVERIPFWPELRFVVSASFCVAGLEVAFSFLRHDIVARSPMLAVFPLFPLFAVTANRVVKQLLMQAGTWTMPVVILGDEVHGQTVEAALKLDRLLGYRVVGRVDPAAIMAAPAGARLSTLLNHFGGRRLLIALDGEGPLQRRIIDCALRERIPFGILCAPGARHASFYASRRLPGHDTRLLTFNDQLARPLARFMKSAMDLVLAGLLLVLAMPVFLAIAAVSWLDGGPIFFAHARIGAGGQAFHCLKFRTMVVNSGLVLEDALSKDPILAAEWKSTRKLIHDPRVTTLGRFLRSTSLDELPQLINVLRRDMSMVGPRPIVESEIHLYGEDIAHYYTARPGLTGLWQVSGRSTTTYARRVELDVWYVNNWTIRRDLAVLLKTIPVVLLRQGAC